MAADAGAGKTRLSNPVPWTFLTLISAKSSHGGELWAVIHQIGAVQLRAGVVLKRHRVSTEEKLGNEIQTKLLTGNVGRQSNPPFIWSHESYDSKIFSNVVPLINAQSRPVIAHGIVGQRSLLPNFFRRIGKRHAIASFYKTPHFVRRVRQIGNKVEPVGIEANREMSFGQSIKAC